MKVLLDLVLAVLLIATASAFLQSTTRCEKVTSRSITTIFIGSKASSPTEESIQSDNESFRETKNDSKIKSASSSCWSMEMDWTLQDAVPQFTVMSKEHTATFWHSFQAAHSEFKQFSESELEERYMYLVNNNSDEQEQQALPLLVHVIEFFFVMIDSLTLQLVVSMTFLNLESLFGPYYSVGCDVLVNIASSTLRI